MIKQRKIVYTSAALNYLDKVLILAESVKKNSDDYYFVFVCNDKKMKISIGQPIDEIIFIEDLNIPNFVQWSFCHTIVELCTAVKPFAMNALLMRNDVEHVVYLDPDIQTYCSLAILEPHLQQNSILLTPHITHYEVERSGIYNNEMSALRHGIYNLGFICVKNDNTGNEFARWWADRLYEFCQDNIPMGLFTDQKWIDLVPAVFDNVKILREKIFNSAPWNISTRSIYFGADNRPMIEGEDLIFYHFTGIDSGAHLGELKKFADSENGAFSLYEEYLKLADKADDTYSSLPWSYGYYNDDTKIENYHRAEFRKLFFEKRPTINPYDAQHKPTTPSTEPQKQALIWIKSIIISQSKVYLITIVTWMLLVNAVMSFMITENTSQWLLINVFLVASILIFLIFSKSWHSIVKGIASTIYNKLRYEQKDC